MISLIANPGYNSTAIYLASSSSPTFSSPVTDDGCRPPLMLSSSKSGSFGHHLAWPCRSETATVPLQLGFLVLDVRPTQEAAMKLLDLSPKHGYASSSVVDGDLECASGSKGHRHSLSRSSFLWTGANTNKAALAPSCAGSGARTGSTSIARRRA